MHRCLPVLIILLSSVGSSHAQGLLIPASKYKTQPLAVVNHDATIAIQDQVAETVIEQTFRNHTARELEANYIFPVPRGASVRSFKMLVDGVAVEGKLVDGPQARQLCAECVRLSQDPGMVDYFGNNLLTMTVRGIQPGKDVTVSTRFTALITRDADLVEYVYPLKTDGKANSTLERFSIKANIKSQQPILNVYSPTHAVTIKRTSDREIHVAFVEHLWARRKVGYLLDQIRANGEIKELVDEIGGIWVDAGYDSKKTKTVAVKALGDAYFRLLELHPELKEVFRMGHHLVWVTPSGTALLLDTCTGAEALTDEEIAALFTKK